MSAIATDDLVEFTENCTAIGAAKCREKNLPGRVVGIMDGKYKTYLVDAGLGYCIYVGQNDIRPFKSVKKGEVCKV